MVVMLPRQPGSRESRYAHLLGESVTIATGTATVREDLSTAGRLERLEAEMAELRHRIALMELQRGVPDTN